MALDDDGLMKPRGQMWPTFTNICPLMQENTGKVLNQEIDLTSSAARESTTLSFHHRDGHCDPIIVFLSNYNCLVIVT